MTTITGMPKVQAQSAFMVEKRRNQAQGEGDPDTESPFGEAVVVPIEDAIDLHSFAPKDIPSVVAEYLDQCGQAGFHEVRLIHGRGRGVQRRVIRSLLERHPMVQAFHDAPVEAGGWGATIVQLKR